MILEGIVSTLNDDGSLNVKPMGPKLDASWPRRFLLRPYRTSVTYRNLEARGEGVLHVTDDVLLLTKAILGQLQPEELAVRPAEQVQGRILLDSCRYYEFRITKLDNSQDRAAIWAETVTEGRLRDFFGFNRAKHAVIEAAILATRVDLLPLSEIWDEYRRLAVPVEKTGGDAEFQAFALLSRHVHQIARDRGLRTGPPWEYRDSQGNSGSESVVRAE